MVAVVLSAGVLAGCSGDSQTKASSSDKQACALWNGIQGTQASDSSAVRTLNQIADLATNLQVIKRANGLAIALEGSSTQTQVHIAYQEMDAACAAIGE